MNPPTEVKSWQDAAVWIAFFALQGYMIWQQNRNHKLMNSRLSELQAETKMASHASGVIEGTKSEQDRAKGVGERLEEIRGQQ